MTRTSLVGASGAGELAGAVPRRLRLRRSKRGPALRSRSGPAASPRGAATPSTTFTFRLTVADKTGATPAWVRVQVNGSTSDLAGGGTNFKAGVVFSGTRSLPVGTWPYSFAVRSGGTTCTLHRGRPGDGRRGRAPDAQAHTAPNAQADAERPTPKPDRREPRRDRPRNRPRKPRRDRPASPARPRQGRRRNQHRPTRRGPTDPASTGPATASPGAPSEPGATPIPTPTPSPTRRPVAGGGTGSDPMAEASAT